MFTSAHFFSFFLRPLHSLSLSCSSTISLFSSSHFYFTLICLHLVNMPPNLQAYIFQPNQPTQSSQPTHRGCYQELLSHQGQHIIDQLEGIPQRRHNWTEEEKRCLLVINRFFDIAWKKTPLVMTQYFSAPSDQYHQAQCHSRWHSICRAQDRLWREVYRETDFHQPSTAISNIISNINAAARRAGLSIIRRTEDIDPGDGRSARHVRRLTAFQSHHTMQTNPSRTSSGRISARMPNIPTSTRQLNSSRSRREVSDRTDFLEDDIKEEDQVRFVIDLTSCDEPSTPSTTAVQSLQMSQSSSFGSVTTSGTLVCVHKNSILIVSSTRKSSRQNQGLIASAVRNIGYSMPDATSCKS
jgi:hypothetical protein